MPENRKHVIEVKVTGIITEKASFKDVKEEAVHLWK